ncbi:hypothetical protein M405DRAFT_913925 [Rhizopogon salebrosus TDB-379]|nr:hypothetical protein M405DRAFT_913925 [Rhizopogon salebrosus TDB-379]
MSTLNLHHTSCKFRIISPRDTIWKSHSSRLEPLRESIWLPSVDGRYSSKWTVLFLLCALGYLHPECHAIHTSKFDDDSILTVLIVSRIWKPQKVLPDRTIYLSKNNFGPSGKGLKPGETIGSHHRCTSLIQRRYMESRSNYDMGPI